MTFSNEVLERRRWKQELYDNLVNNSSVFLTLFFFAVVFLVPWTIASFAPNELGDATLDNSGFIQYERVQ